MLLQCHVTSLGSTCSVAQKNEPLDQRHKLEARITAYEHCITEIIKLNDDTQWATEDGHFANVDCQTGEASDDLLELDAQGSFTLERECITLPHWHQERPNVNLSNHLKLLKPSYAKVK